VAEAPVAGEHTAGTQGGEARTVLASVTANPARLAELEQRVSQVSLETGHPLSLVATRESTEVRTVLPEAAILLTYRFDPDQLAAATALEWIHFGAAGIEHSIFPELLHSGVRITTAKGIHGDVMAEYVVMAIIALATGLPQSAAAARRREWIGRELRPLHHSIAGRRLLVLGLGHVGRPIARLAAALGMKVRGVRRRAGEGILPDGVGSVHTLAELDDLLPETDYLVIAMPRTSETNRLLDRRRLLALPAGSGIVNVARGTLIDEAALIEVLDSGHLRGAVLDSFATEPLPAESPLWEHPRAIVTPHIAGNFDDYTRRVIVQFCENLRRYLTGAELLNPYDPEGGY